MRTINEIIEELKIHPDYMVSEIFTWVEYLEETNECYYDEFEGDGFSPILKTELTIEIKQEIIDHVQRSIRYIYNPYVSLTRLEENGSIELSYLE